MVGREVKIERRVFTIKQGKKGSFDVLTFEEHGLSLGSLTIELASFLSKTIHNVADNGASGKNFWRSGDMMYWIKLHKRSNMFGEVMQVSWARKLRNSGKMMMEVPGGVGLVGWKRFATALESLNPTTQNWGDDLFPSAYFAGRTRAYNDPHNAPLTTTVDALGQPNTLGEWKSGIICNRPVTILSWKAIGKYIVKRFNISATFELLPLDELRAVFFIEEPDKQSKIVCSKGASINNWYIGFTAWTPQSHKLPPLSKKRVFWISLSGVPLNLWTPEIIRNLTAHCGEFLMINAENLTLDEVSSIKVKVRNVKGPNGIPRVLLLQSPEGDFEVQVDIVLSSQLLSSPSQQRVLIPEVEDDESEAEVANIANVVLSEETISDNWSKKVISRQRFIKDVATPSTCYRTIAYGESYTTLTNPQLRMRKRRGQRKKKQKRKDKTNCLARKHWRWVPKNPTTPLCNNSLGATVSNSNSITVAQQVAPQVLFTGSPRSEVPKLSYIEALIRVPTAIERGVSVIAPHPGPLVTESTYVKGTFTEDSNSNSILQDLALRRFQVGLDVGMTVADRSSQALELIRRNIRRDEEAVENFNLQHQNPDVCLTQGELLVEGDSETEPEQEDSDRSIRTPLAPFIDPMDSWNESFLQVEYSNDSISIPPGFENYNLCSIRSLKSSIKNHHNNKKHCAGVSHCA